MLGVILFRLSENSFLMDEISENILNEELNKLFLVKVQIREDYTWLSTAWRPKIWNEEIQNTHHSSHSVSLNLKDDNYWKPINGQIKLNVRLHLCSEVEMKDHFHQECYARSCREIEELKRCCCQEDWENFRCNMIRDHEQWVYWEIRYEDYKNDTNSESIERSSTKITRTRTIGIYWRLKNLLWSWFTEQLWLYLRSSWSSHYFEFKIAKPRSWNAAKYTRRCEYFWKRFWLWTCSTRSWWITQWFKKFGRHHQESLTMTTILRKERIEKSRSEEPLRSILLTCFSVRARRKSLDDK